MLHSPVSWDWTDLAESACKNRNLLAESPVSPEIERNSPVYKDKVIQLKTTSTKNYFGGFLKMLTKYGLNSFEIHQLVWFWGKFFWTR